MVVLGLIALASAGLMWAVAACPLGRAIAISAGQNAARRDPAAGE
jgi:hypothetical protein